MNRALLLAAALLVAACTWTTGPRPDDPDDKVMRTGSHIPVKDNSSGKATAAGDADAMMRSQRALGASGGTSR
jgi:hypothetical protein